MKRAIAIAAIVASAPGCATSWIVSQAAGEPKVWDEHAHDEHVPLPGLTEQLTVSLPLTVDYEPLPVPPPPITPGVPAPTHGDAKPFELECKSEQSGKDAVYHAAFRYGHTWKVGAVAAFLAEGLIGTALLLGVNPSKDPGWFLSGGFLALDAAVTLPLIFIPRKEVYDESEVAVTTPMRWDCPDGLALAFGGERYPVDAAGRLGALGTQALAEFMAAPTGDLRAVFADQEAVMPLNDPEICQWQSQHPPDPKATPAPGTPPPTTNAACDSHSAGGGYVAGPRNVSVVITVAPGTLATVATASRAPSDRR